MKVSDDTRKGFDDARNAHTRLRVARIQTETEVDTATATLSGTLYTRLRSFAALDWASDVVLRDACGAFARSLINGMLAAEPDAPAAPDPMPDPEPSPVTPDPVADPVPVTPDTEPVVTEPVVTDPLVVAEPEPGTKPEPPADVPVVTDPDEVAVEPDPPPSP